MMRGARFVVALATAILAAPCLAQDYPTRPVKIIVPFGAGGPADVAARQIGSILQENFGQPFIIENRTGAGGVIGTLEVTKAAPDGYTLLIGPEVTFVVNPSLYPKLSYDPVKGFTSISGLVTINHALIANPALVWKPRYDQRGSRSRSAASSRVIRRCASHSIAWSRRLRTVP